MTAAETKTEGNLTFWKKLWRALTKGFKRKETCACSAEHGSALKLSEPKAEEKRAAA